MLASWSATEYLFDADVCQDGSIVVGRVNTGSGQFQYTRIADPAVAAQWTGASWSNVQAGSANKPAVVADPQSADVWLLWVYSDGRTIRAQRSQDNGVSWGAIETARAEAVGTTVTNVTGAIRYTGLRDFYLFYSYSLGGAGADDQIRLVVRSFALGTWAAPLTWTLSSYYSWLGLDCLWDGDFFLCAGTRQGTSPYPYWLMTFCYGDGSLLSVGTWGALGFPEQSQNTSMGWAYPSWCNVDGVRLCGREFYTGTNAYSQAFLMNHLPATAPTDLYWVEPQVMDYAPVTTAPVACGRMGASYMYLVSYNKAWRCTLTGREVDVSARVKFYRHVEGSAAGRLTVILENDDGALSSAGTGTYRSIRAGSDVRLGRGLYVGATAYTADANSMVVESVEWRDLGGRGEVVLHCLDWRGVLKRWRAARSFEWAAGGTTLAAMCSTVLARVGLSFSNGGSGSSVPGAFQPGIAITPGTDGLTAFGRLLGRAPDVAYLVADGVQYKQLTLSEAGVYAVGGSGEHPVQACTLLEDSPESNLFEVYGATVYGRYADVDSVLRVGSRRRLWVDGVYTVGADVTARAAAEFQEAQVGRVHGWLRLFPIFGLELYDVLTVSVARLWASTRRYRVVSIEETFDSRGGSARFEQRLGVVYLGT